MHNVRKILGGLIIAFLVLSLFIYFPNQQTPKAKADITSGLVGHWTFDEGSGTTASDASGNNNTGTVINGPVWEAGKINSGLTLDGVNDYVNIPHSNSLNISGTQITLSAWLKFQSTGTWQTLVTKVNEDGTHNYPYFLYMLGVNNDNRARFFLAVGGVFVDVKSSQALTNGNWYHLTGVYDGTSLRMYVNGVLDGTTNENRTIVSKTSSFRIGAGGTVNEPTKGSVDDIRVYNRALTQSDITELFNNTGGSTTPPPPPPSSDTTPPTVSITSPSNGSTVSGSSVSITANASDNVGISGVQFKLNGSNLGSEDTQSPYSTTWNSTQSTNGTYTLTATARDAAGNQSTSSGVSVTVSNTTTPPPPPSSALSWSAPQAISGAPASNITITSDFNRDGITDFAVFEGGKHAGTKVFAWFASPSFTKHEFNPGFATAEFLGSADARDMDGDGDEDIVFSMDHHSGMTQEGWIYWGENPGGAATGNWTMRMIHHFTSGTEHINDMVIEDLDNDGRLDIVARHIGTNKVRILFQNSLTSWTLKTIDVKPREGLSVADFDNDGRKDLLLNGFWLASPANPRTDTWLEFSIDSVFYTQPDSGLNNAAKTSVADIDGDGRIDAVIATAEGATGKLAWYKNPGNPRTQAWIVNTLESSVTGMHQAELGDVDLDGDLDVMGGLAFGQTGVFNYLLQGTSFAKNTVTTSQGLYYGKLADLDADGDLDIVGSTTYASQVYVYKNLLRTPGTTPPPPPPVNPPPPPPVNQVPTGNFDEIRLSDGVIRGWTYDPNTTSTSNEVHIYINGPAGAGGTLLSGFPTNTLRSDINTTFGITGNHGFEYTIPSQYRNGVQHSIYVYGVDTSSSAISTLLSGSPKTFTLGSTTPPPPPPSNGTINAASCNQTDVQAAINLAVDGSTVIIPAGNCSWASGVSINSKGIHLTASSLGSVTINHNAGSSDLLTINRDATHEVRISNLRFREGSATEGSVHIAIDGPPHPATGYKAVLVYNNDFWTDGGLDRSMEVRMAGGTVIHHNTFDSNGKDDQAIGFKAESAGQEVSWTMPPTWGTADTSGLNNHYVEDNTFIRHTNQTMDVDSNARVVIRYNTFDRSAMSSHGIDTGFGSGGRHAEVYNNTFLWTNHGDCDGSLTANLSYYIFIRGGSWVITDNIMPDLKSCAWGDKSEIIMTVMNLRRNAGTYACWNSGYPAPHQVGRGTYAIGDPAFASSVVDPLYIWNNQVSGQTYTSGFVARSNYSPDECGGGADVGNYIQLNRDYILGPRPNYTKYTYPHPLVSGSSVTPPPPPPVTPPPPSTISKNVTIDLEGRTDKTINGTLEVLNSSKSLIKSYPFTTSSSGTASFNLDQTSGSLFFKIKASPYLSRLLSGDINTTLTFPQLKTGDINQDNIVNSIDFSTLNTNWFTTHQTSDLNRDSIVNSLDFSLMNRNWFVRGEE